MRAPRLLRALALAILLLPVVPRLAGAAQPAPAAAPSGLDAQWLAADRMACELAARTRDVPALERCTANLYAVAPRDAKTLELQWALALARGQAQEARALLTRAKALALPAEGIARMEDATNALLPEARPIRRTLFIVACLLCLGAAGIGTVISLRRPGGPRPAPRWWPTS